MASLDPIATSRLAHFVGYMFVRANVSHAYMYMLLVGAIGHVALFDQM